MFAALLFAFVNGMHDAGNAIATVVSTGVLRPRTAVVIAGVLNFLGAYAGTAVVTTVSRGIVAPEQIGPELVLAALGAATVWNLVTWFYGIPSSSTHALIGGLLGAASWSLGPKEVEIGAAREIAAAVILSPILGFGLALTLTIGLLWTVRSLRPGRANVALRALQIGSSSLVAFAHGAADAPKTAGIVVLALLAWEGPLPLPEGLGVGSLDAEHAVHLPRWILDSAAAAVAIGTLFGGWRIVRTMGSRIFKLRPVHGLAAETSAAVVLLAAAVLGFPSSTTHTITAAIIGAGATTRLSAVSWGLTRSILQVWIATPFACGLLAALGLALFG